MKDFLKMTGASILGVFLSAILLFFVGMLLLVGVVATTDSEVKVRDNSVMMLKLDGALTERSISNPIADFLGKEEDNMGLNDVLSAIKKAKEESNIKGLYLQMGSMGVAPASLLEIRKALVDFKSSGKFLVAYGDSYSQGGYYLASLADKIVLNPIGAVDWKGLAAKPMFYKELLDKVGIEMQIFKVGTFKSAVEPFIMNEMSEPNRLQITELLSSLWGQILTDVSASRHLSKEELSTLADNLVSMQSAQACVDAKLVDTLLYKDEMLSYLKELAGVDKEDRLHTLEVNEMKNVNNKIAKDKSGNVIAVYYAFGGIDDGKEGTGIHSEKVMKELRGLRLDENVKAVVFRVNSPGGSAYGSEQIWRELMLLKAEKPLIVSMGDYAASGGYYISTAADTIVAEPSTITGSIGVFGMFPNSEKLIQKVGLHFDLVKTNKYADFGSLNRPFNAGEKGFIQSNVNRTYKLFVQRCADSRNMSTSAIEAIAEGRVWTGERAIQLGLVDVLGNLDDAITIAKEKAGIENYTLLSYPDKPSIFDQFKMGSSDNYITTALTSLFGEYIDGFVWLNNLDKMDRVQARLPYQLIIK
ncbi:MAG: signal peptide peptidase SppA [Bacteroidaceae bacterium]|nr:signal peptide peptidase SppA [Bacteroidaceae bacterium]